MRVIVVAGKKDGKKTHLMIELLDKKVIEEVKTLINSLKCSKAIFNIIAKGKFIKELTEKEIVHEKSELILTNTNAYWNLL